MIQYALESHLLRGVGPIVVPGYENPLSRCAGDHLDLCPQELEILGVVLPQSLLVDVVPEKNHRRRNSAPVELRHRSFEVLKDRVVVELHGTRVPDQKEDRVLILRPLNGARRRGCDAIAV